MGKCVYCGNDAGFLRRKHSACQQVRDAGWREMVDAAAHAAQAPDFSGVDLTTELSEIAEESWMGEDDVRAAIAEVWSVAVSESLADGVLTRQEEARLRVFREQVAGEGDLDGSAKSALEQASRARLVNEARLAALSVGAPETVHDAISTALDESIFSPEEQRAILIGGWELAVSHSLEDDLLSMEEETALTRYMERFNLGQEDLNEHGAFRDFVKAGVIREVASGVIPKRQSVAGGLPMNFQKSEELVWVFDDVDYYEVKTRRQRRGSSHGVSVRVARGLYYSPRTFSSETYEWDETVRLDTGLMAVTTKHIYFHGSSKRFRVRYDKIVSFDQYNDGIGIMRDAQTAKPQSFRTGDGWFVYNLVTNLARQ